MSSVKFIVFMNLLDVVDEHFFLIWLSFKSYTQHTNRWAKVFKLQHYLWRASRIYSQYINDFNACTKDLKFIHFAQRPKLLLNYIKLSTGFKFIGFPLMFQSNISQCFPVFPELVYLLFLLIELIWFTLLLQSFLEYQQKTNSTLPHIQGTTR